MATVEKVYPLHLTETEKNFLLPHLEKWLQALYDSGSEGVRQYRWLSPVLERLKACKGEDKMLYEFLVKEAMKREKMKGNRYVVLKVSKRTHQIIQMDETGSEYNPSHAMSGGPGLPDETMVMLSAKPITKNLQYGDMRKLYTLLALGLEIPDDMQKFMLSEDDD